MEALEEEMNKFAEQLVNVTLSCKRAGLSDEETRAKIRDATKGEMFKREVA